VSAKAMLTAATIASLFVCSAVLAQAGMKTQVKGGVPESSQGSQGWGYVTPANDDGVNVPFQLPKDWLMQRPDGLPPMKDWQMAPFGAGLPSVQALTVDLSVTRQLLKLQTDAVMELSRRIDVLDSRIKKLEVHGGHKK